MEYTDKVPLPVALHASELCALTVRDCPTLQASDVSSQSAQGGSEADGVAIPQVRDTGQHEWVIQTVIGGLVCDDAEPAVGAVQKTIVEATVVEEAAMKEVTHSQDVEKTVSISHRVLGTVVAKDLGTVDDKGIYTGGPVDIDSGGSEGEADAGDPPAIRLVYQGKESESEGHQPDVGMDQVGYPGLSGKEREAGTAGAVDVVVCDQGE